MLPPQVQRLCDQFLRQSPPGLITGLYLRGGIGFGEWIEGVSDVDFVATVAHRPTPAEIDQLRDVHRGLREQSPTDFSGIHILADDLARDPRECPEVPTVLDGDFRVGPPLDGMICWHELARRGVTVTGTPHTERPIWTSQPDLISFTRGNLDGYWRNWADRLAAVEPDKITDRVCAWCVLGVTRLHHLLITGEMTSKSGAGRWGPTFYDEPWHRVLAEGLRCREGGPPQYAAEPELRAAEVSAFVAMVVQSGTAGPDRAG
ncbi:DUF4111 domain-containing protein [Microlunatus elymi]|uniref:DUF4111 domain-containing protein n=1 Tax=Microlunatus elymi TaxID=2596828 RepID=A0A516PZ60_9ACTN|nr:DUF4111 domain-containing protein [Microlunatus elymi]QDP96447.1 DUF4111 domain-containing protein [Microlunatus elymi]